MTLQQRINDLSELGKFLSQFSSEGIEKNSDIKLNDPYFNKLYQQIESAVHYNGWFTKDNILFAIDQWSKALTDENLSSWVKEYDFSNSEEKTVAIIMAGNIPMVGFHDFISVLISGNKVIGKLSSNDKWILPILAEYLIALNPGYKEKISFTEGRLTEFDAVIATGSNNTARYFEYYFANKPSIIRKNRNSVAVLDGNESKEDLELLGRDIFRYFGLGCRNVSKLYVPENYDFDAFYKAIDSWYDYLMNHAKYANNYDYNKAVYLMSEFKFLDNGFLMLKEDENFGSPIATVFYEIYQSKEKLEQELQQKRENLQCIVGNNFGGEAIPFGTTQLPALSDFADNVNTLAFLEKL